MSTIDLFDRYWDKLLIPISTLVTWFFTKRSFEKKDLKLKDVNIDSSSSEVVSKNLEIYQRMLDDVDERYQTQLKNRDLEIKLLEQENANLKIKVSDLTNKVEGLIENVKELDKKLKNINK